MTTIYRWLLCTLGIMAITMLQAQNNETRFTLKGTIIDKDSNPVVGATVYSPQTQLGSVTSVDGKFQIETYKGDELSITFLGYKPYKTIVNSANPLQIVLESDSQEINEVIVVGYGTLTKKEVTSSISRVTGEDLNKVTGTTVSNALKGKTTGLRVFSTSGAPGTQASITIRGGSSINKSNDALILIDGVPGALSNVNPQDIASIEILKDAASTACLLYTSPSPRD